MLEKIFKLQNILLEMGKIIGIISLKGGVGKTSIVSSLGAAISGFDKKVLVIDGNLSTGTLGLHLNVIEPDVTLNHVLGRKANITEAIYKLKNFDVIFSSMFKQIKVNPLKLKDKIKSLKRKYDFILLDSSPSLDEETLAVMLASDELFVLTTPDYPTLNATLRAIKLAKQRGTKIDGLIINKVHNKNFEISVNDIETTAEIPVMAVIPYDIRILKALSKFNFCVNCNPRSAASTEIKKLAAVLVGEEYKPFSLKNLFRIIPEKQEINRELFYESVFEN